MGENNNSIINNLDLDLGLGDLSQAKADVSINLFNKFCSAIGWLTEPYRIVRLAKANSEARLIEETTNLKIEHLKKNFPDSEASIDRFLGEERKKQENTLSIIKKTIRYLKETAKPQDIDNDWILNFNDKSKLISEESMQEHWARILAEEANQPQSFSKRTVNLMAELEKRDAEAFTNLCALKWEIFDSNNQFLFISSDFENDTSNLFNKIDYDLLIHIESIGLIKKAPLTEYFSITSDSQKGQIKHANSSYSFEFQNETTNKIIIGAVLLTPMGKELSKICNPEPIRGFEEYTSHSAPFYRNHQKAFYEWL
jgi:hypothetical protein